jgi:hypothetical protein
MTESRRINGWLFGWLIAYVALMAAVVGSMFWVQRTVLAEFSTHEATAEWQAWRGDVSKQQTNPGPVKRDIPKSEVPPALVLMRDYFVVSLVGATFFTSLLYWIMAWLVTGALSNQGNMHT